jgi:ribosomal protein S12 methylthiotransferase
LLPISPAQRPEAVSEVSVPGHRWGPTAARKRLDDAPVAYLKLASGCDRRCTFCAIPSFRGAFVSRRPSDLVAEARWLAASGVRELVLVSENSTSYGKDLGDLRALEKLLPDLAEIEGICWIRVSYLQPAELRPSLLSVIATTPGVVPYFDLSFQHAAIPVLRRMKRFGSTDSFVDLLTQARTLAPTAGARSNVIVGFPGETEDDVAELERFLTQARLDVVGVFGYSDEDGTEAETFDGKHDPDVVAARVERVTALAEELMSQRAEDRIGDMVEVLVEEVSDDELTGRAAHQAPETDGAVKVVGDVTGLRPGSLVAAIVVDNEGADLIAEVVPGSVR